MGKELTSPLSGATLELRRHKEGRRVGLGKIEGDKNMADDQYNLICIIRGCSQIRFFFFGGGGFPPPKWRIRSHPLPVIGSDSTTDLTYRLYRAARAAIDTLSLIPREKADIYQYNINEGKAVMKV